MQGDNFRNSPHRYAGKVEKRYSSGKGAPAAALGLKMGGWQVPFRLHLLSCYITTVVEWNSFQVFIILHTSGGRRRHRRAEGATM